MFDAGNDVRSGDAREELAGHDAGARHELVERADRLHALIGRSMRELLALLVEIDRAGVWDDDGARDIAHWTQMRYGVSGWKAHRWVDAASALERLPLTAHALERGRLGADKVVELARFATAADEERLLAWAQTVSTGAIRRRADVETRRPPEASSDLDRERRCRWWLREAAPPTSRTSSCCARSITASFTSMAGRCAGRPPEPSGGSAPTDRASALGPRHPQRDDERPCRRLRDRSPAATSPGHRRLEKG